VFLLRFLWQRGDADGPFMPLFSSRRSALHRLLYPTLQAPLVARVLASGILKHAL